MDWNNVTILPQMADVTHGRNKYLGGSSMPIILGISPFKTRYELLLEKSDIKEKDFFGNKYTEYGIELEPVIREHISQNYGMMFEEYTAYCGNIRFNDDGVSDDYILEIKTTSQIKENVRDYKPYIVQLLLGMVLHKKPGILAVYHRPDDMDKTFDEQKLTLYHIEFEDYREWLEEIEDAIEKFWEDLNVLNTAYILDGEVLPEEHFIPTDLVAIGNQIQVFEQQIKLMKEIEEKKKKYMAQIKSLMEKENIKTFELASGTKITLVEDKPDTYTTFIDYDKIKKDLPETIEKYTEDVIVKQFNQDKFEKECPEICNDYLDQKKKKGRKGHVRITLKKEGK